MTSTAELTSSWERWPAEDKRLLSRRLWEELRRTEQTPPTEDWSVWYVRGGRGSGKTRTGAEGLAEDIILTLEAGDGPELGDWAVVAPTFADARDTCVEGPSGLRSALAGYIEKWNRSMGQLNLLNGATVFCDGADDGALRIQGKNLRGAWCDEPGLWKITAKKDGERLDGDTLEVRAWDESIAFAVRLGPAHIYVTGTPKRGHVLVKRLIHDDLVVKTHMKMEDNIANLHPSTVERLIAKYANTSLGRQELEGHYSDEVEGALWTRAMIDASRISDRGRLARIVVAIDPPGGATEAGIVAVGLTAGTCPCGGTNLPHAIVLKDASLFPSGPNHWATTGINLYHDLQADKLIGEVNYGGDMVENTVTSLDSSVFTGVVRASRGKIPRAEPIAGLYGDPARPETWQKSRVHHLEMFTELEDEMTTYTSRDAGAWSPNRMDALVWAITELGLNAETDATVNAAPLVTARIGRSM